MTADFLALVPKQIIPKDMVHDAILNPPISWYGGYLFFEPVEKQFEKWTYPVEGLLRDTYDMDRFALLGNLLE